MTVHIKHQVTFHTIKIRSNIKHQITSRQSNTRAFAHQILSASPCSSVSSSAPRFSYTAADNVDFAQIVLRYVRKVDTCRPNCEGLYNSSSRIASVTFSDKVSDPNGRYPSAICLEVFSLPSFVLLSTPSS